jgi:ABC-type bacteriocin/lantibiotic exporter with double-glycine peptidase domain
MNVSSDRTGRELAGDAALHPTAGSVVEVLTGEVLVFVELASGRRLPVMTRKRGEIVVGCGTTATGARLLLTGQVETTIRESTVDEVMDAEARPFDEWVHALGEAARNGSWATKVVAPELEGFLRLAPGEAVVPSVAAVPPTDRSILGWLKVTSGEARFCGRRTARVGERDVAVPITRGGWLTSGLRCQIALAQAPLDVDGWIRALDLIGSLTLEAVGEREAAADDEGLARRSVAEEVSTAQTMAGVDLLVGAAVGTMPRPRILLGERSTLLAAAFTTIENAGYDLDESARERAQSQVSNGREPFAAAAAAGGVRARAVDLAPQWWRQEGPPLVAAARDGHFYCLNWTGQAWAVSDPRDPGVKFADASEIRERLNGRAWEFLPVLAPVPLQLADLRRLALKRSGRDVFVVGLLSIGLALLSFFTPFILGKVAGAVNLVDTRVVVTALIVLTILLLVSVSWRYVRSVALVRIRTRGTTLAGGATWDRMMRLRTNWHSQHSLGDRMTQSTAVATSSTMVPNYVLVDVLDAVTVVGGLAAVATTNTALLAAVTLMLVIQLAVNIWLTRESARRTATRVSASADSQGRLLEILRAVDQLKVYGAESRAFRRWAIPQARLTRTDLAVRRIATVQALAIRAWPVLGLIVLVGVSGLSNASFGEFVTAQAALAIAGTALGATALSTSALMSGRAVLSTLKPVLAATPEGDAQGVELGLLNGDVALHDVTFRYEPGGKAVLDGISFTVSAGEQVAIVGPSGCGKTTLVRMLLGLEDPESGVLTVDGRDVSVLDRPSFRRQVGCVMQSSALMPGSIAYNVDMGRGLTSADIWRALEWAAVADEVHAMSQGLDTIVVDGSGAVSGGQRQRILLARALAGNPRMLILDEATSAQDNVTQALVNDHMENLRVTRIVIAHRLTTIAGADRILVMDKGKVVQQGTFEELAAQPGHFAELIHRQAV